LGALKAIGIQTSIYRSIKAESPSCLAVDWERC
jgi:hypothetical protein